MKTKCEHPRDEKLEWKWKRAWVEEVEAGPNGLKRMKKTSEGNDGMIELVEVLQAGLKGITDALSKQGRLLQELVELEADKVELIQYDLWASEDKEDEEEEEETEEGVEVEVEQELLELGKEIGEWRWVGRRGGSGGVE